MYPDFEQLLSALNAEGANYLIVGGYAVGEYAQPRATKDLDILIGSDSNNAAAIFRVLVKFGAPLQGMTPEGLVETGTFYRVGVPPIMFDILPEIAGVDFKQAWDRRVIGTVNHETGLQAPFISVDDLITAKVAAGRPQDLADVDALRKAKGKK